MNPENSVSQPNPEPDWLAVVRNQVSQVRFGVVQLMIHEGRVVQVERTERVRVENPPRNHRV